MPGKTVAITINGTGLHINRDLWELAECVARKHGVPMERLLSRGLELRLKEVQEEDGPTCSENVRTFS